MAQTLGHEVRKCGNFQFFRSKTTISQVFEIFQAIIVIGKQEALLLGINHFSTKRSLKVSHFDKKTPFMWS